MNMKVQHNPLASSFIVLLLSSLLFACGGSSSDSGSNYSVSVDQSSIEFINEAGAESDEIISVNVSYSGEGLLVGIPNDGTVPAWLNYRVAELTDSTAVLEFSLDQEDLIAPDTYTTQVRVTSGDVENNQFVHRDITISLNIWQLTIDDTAVSLEATKGDSDIDEFDIRIIAGNTNYTISSDLPWLSFESTEGEGTGELETIVATADYSSIEEAGVIEGTVTITESTTESELTIPVSLALDEVYLYSNQTAVSFVKTANTEYLSQTIDISANAETPLTWEASTTADFLTLTPSSDGTALTITADPTNITAETIASAQVNIASSGSLSAQSGVIEVAVYHSAATLPDAETIDSITVNEDGLAINPLSPYLYAAVGNTVRVYHQYTLALMETISVTSDSLDVENLTITKDGKYLFALTSETVNDAEGNPTTFTNHYRVNLTTSEVDALVDADIAGLPVEHLIIDGRQYVITDSLEFASLDLTIAYSYPGNFSVDQVEYVDSSNALYITTGGADVYRFTTSVNEFASETINATFDQSYRPENGNNAGIFDIVINNTDESQIYLLNSGTDWLSFTDESFTDNGRLIADDTSTSLGLVSNQSKTPFYLRFDTVSRVYVESFDATQTKVSDTTLLTLLPDLIEIDASGTRFISYASGLTSIIFNPIKSL